MGSGIFPFLGTRSWELSPLLSPQSPSELCISSAWTQILSDRRQLMELNILQFACAVTVLPDGILICTYIMQITRVVLRTISYKTMPFKIWKIRSNLYVVNLTGNTRWEFNNNSGFTVESFVNIWGAAVWCFILSIGGGNEDCWRKLPNEARRAENRGWRPIAGAGFLGRAASPSPSATGLGPLCGAEPRPPKGFHYFQHSGWPLLIIILLILDNKIESFLSHSILSQLISVEFARINVVLSASTQDHDTVRPKHSAKYIRIVCSQPTDFRVCS